MKLCSTALTIGLLSFGALANTALPIQDVSVTKTSNNFLSLQNLSNSEIKLDIYGIKVELVPGTGSVFNCDGYEFLEIIIEDEIHDFFEVSCSAQVIFSEDFRK